MRFYDDCIDAIDWVEKISGYRPKTNVSLEQLEELTQNNQAVMDARGQYFDYPLSETTYITDNAELFDEIQLVRFGNDNEYEYRLCEV